MNQVSAPPLWRDDSAYKKTHTKHCIKTQTKHYSWNIQRALFVRFLFHQHGLNPSLGFMLQLYQICKIYHVIYPMFETTVPAGNLFSNFYNKFNEPNPKQCHRAHMSVCLTSPGLASQSVNQLQVSSLCLCFGPWQWTQIRFQQINPELLTGVLGSDIVSTWTVRIHASFRETSFKGPVWRHVHFKHLRSLSPEKTTCRKLYVGQPLPRNQFHLNTLDALQLNSSHHVLQ